MSKSISSAYRPPMSDDDIMAAVKRKDGAGSGLDADTMDGLHADSFVQQAAAQKMKLSSQLASSDAMEDWIEQQYTQLPNDSIGHIEVNCNFSGYAVSAGRWYITLYKTNSSYGALIAINYGSLTQNSLIRVRARISGAWAAWRSISSTAVSADEPMPGPEIMDDAAGDNTPI